MRAVHREYMKKILLAGALVMLIGCSRNTDSPTTLHVAAAANLSRVFPPLARACKAATGLTLVPSFGNTAQLAQQIENGGPFDLFLAADVKHIQDLDAAHHVVHDSVHNYAQGRLVLFAPRRPDIHSLADLKLASVKKIGIAKPELAPYGSATVEALTNAGLWPAIEPKVVYGQNVSAVLQFVDSSNVDAAFTALALVQDRPGEKLTVDPKLHTPIDQALAIPSETAHLDSARRAAAWFLSAEAQHIFTESGYGSGSVVLAHGRQVGPQGPKRIATQDPDSSAFQPAATLKP